MHRYPIAIVIPCLNESKTIEKAVLLAKEGLASAGLQGEVVVSDNGSKDASREIARKAGARVVDCTIRGYGAALHYGILCAHAEWVLFGDADMSYDFRDLVNFVPFLNDSQQLVLGSRLNGTIDRGAMPFLNRYLGTPALNFFLRLFFDIRTSDCNSGMRLIRRSYYASLNMRAAGMEWASELLIKTQLKGGKIVEVPIRYHRDGRGHAAHLRRWRDGWRHLKTIIFLSPNRLILIPCFAVLCLSVALMRNGKWELAHASWLVALSGVALAMLLKHLLHQEGSVFSRTVVWMYKIPVLEILLGMGLISTLAGFTGMFFHVEPAQFLVSGGALSVLFACAWGASTQHSLNALAELATTERSREKASSGVA